MSSVNVDRGASQVGRFWRWAIPFRIVAIGIFLVIGVGAQLWKSILTPWIVYVDSSDHGWPRTAELHRVGDTASAALLAWAAGGVLVSAIHPRTGSALGAWNAVTLTIIAAGVTWSSLVQHHSGVAGAALAGGIFFVLTVVPYVLCHPRRRAVLYCGGLDPNSGPRGPTRALLWTFMVTGAVLAVAATTWRVTGGIFEDPREDDVVGIVMLGLSLTTGCAVCLASREGWRLLAPLLFTGAGYCIIGGLSLALT